MLDPYMRTLINPLLNLLGKQLVKFKVSSNTMTLFGFAAGLLAMGAITHHHYRIAAVLFLINRLADGLDGAIARHSQITDFGGVLDIACDFIVYAGIVFAFGLANPENLFYASFLLFSFIGPITTFLAYAIVAAKQQKNTSSRGIKSFYHLGGICEGTETAFVLLLICVFPSSFAWVAIIYGTLCWLTTVGRLYRAYIDFAKAEVPLTETEISREPKYGQAK
jgi:phosphatidylglycerophosphate synthase